MVIETNNELAAISVAALPNHCFSFHANYDNHWFWRKLKIQPQRKALVGSHKQQSRFYWPKCSSGCEMLSNFISGSPLKRFQKMVHRNKRNPIGVSRLNRQWLRFTLSVKGRFFNYYPNFANNFRADSLLRMLKSNRNLWDCCVTFSARSFRVENLFIWIFA